MTGFVIFGPVAAGCGRGHHRPRGFEREVPPVSHLFRSCLAVAVLGGLVVGAGAAERTTYRPVAATVGKALQAPPDLVAVTRRLREAALAGDREAVFALVADDLAFVSTGITATVGRRVEKRSFGPDRAAAALEAIGLAFTEGEPILPGGKTANFEDARIATALRRIAEDLAAPDWAGDPLVPGGYCTRPGAAWDAKAAAAAGLTHRAVFVLAPTEARAKPEPGAKVVARLATGRLWALAGGDGSDGWTDVALPDGRTAWLPPKTAKDAQPWGFCFLPNAAGGWLLAAVISSLN